MASIHHDRPGVDALEVATGEPAVALGDSVWMSPGVSNSYAVETDEGRVIINTGTFFEGQLHRQAYADVPGPTHSILVTQGHGDHWGGAQVLREPDTAVIMQANYYYWRDDNSRLFGFRARNTSFAFERFLARVRELDLSAVDMSFPEPTVTFDRRLDLAIGGRRFEVNWTPGGETTDANVVWLPDDGILFTGNVFGPLFGHVPNLVTMRGDRYRDPIQYIEACDLILGLGPRRLITGHFDPIDGAELIATEVTAMRDAMQWVHDRVIHGMESGEDIHTVMREIALPSHFDVGEGYGRTVWNARAIWEMYAGWFYHRSTTELYAVPPWSIAHDLIDAAGIDVLVAAAKARVESGQPLEALHLTDLVLAGDTENSAAKAVALSAHEQLLEKAENFWEKAWLTQAIKGLSGA
jgi:glyoxylase-like metal-dependent hydrolase (beta-lactamase superfamily II)